MKTNFKIKINQIDSALAPLRKQHDSLEQQIIKLCNARRKLCEERDNIIIKSIPSNLKKISGKQWKWILSSDYSETLSHVQFRDNILYSLGFASKGFNHETQQVAISIPTTIKNSTIKNGFKIIKKYLKPTEFGIKIQISNDDNIDDILYIHEKGNATLASNLETIPYISFDKFIDQRSSKE